MCAIQWFLIKSCIFGMCISVTDAGVVLETFDERTTYLIGSKVELVCSIAPYNNEMTWFVNNDPYADCTVGTCNPYSNKPYAFSFTFNETAGVFKLAIGSVTYSHANLSFACDDGMERKHISFNVTTATSENSNDNSLSQDTKIGLGVGLGVGIPALIACGIALYRRWKRANTIRDIKQRLQKDDKQELLKQIENKELEEIQELKNRQEVIKGSLTEQSDEIKRNRRSLIKENGRITEQLVFKEAQYNTRHSLFPMEGQDNTRHSLFPMEGQDNIRYSHFVVVARNNTGHSLSSKEEQNQAQNKAIDEYIKKDLVNNGIFSTVIMQDIKRIKREKDDQMKLIGQLVTIPQRSKEEVHSTMIREL